MRSKHTQPKLQQYNDYRLFLLDYAKERKVKSSNWSYSVWAKKLGLRGKTPLLMVLNGHRQPSANLTDKLIQYFEFTPIEESFFRTLILHSDKAKPTHRIELNESSVKRKILKAVLTPHEQALVTSWLSIVVKEAAVSMGERFNAKDLAESLLGVAKEAEVIEMIHALLKAGLLESEDSKNPPYKLGSHPEELNWAPDIIRKIHYESLEASKRAYDKLGPEERAFRVTILRMKKERIPEAVLMLRKFQKDFTQMFEEAEGNEIFEMNLHLFATTHGLKI